MCICISHFPLWAYSKGNFEMRVVMKVSHQDSVVGIVHYGGVLNHTSYLVHFTAHAIVYYQALIFGF